MPRLLCIPLLLVAIGASAQVPAPIPPTPPRARPAAVAPRVDVWSPMIDSYSKGSNFEYDLKYDNDYFDKYSLALDNYNLALDSYNFDSGNLGSFAWAGAFDKLNVDLGGIRGFSYGSNSGDPVRWIKDDPADSLYRDARDHLNRGDYRRAAALFKAIPQKYPNSAYTADAQYWQAFALYRIGGTPELQEALAVLDARKPAPEAGDTRPRPGERPRASVNSGMGSGVSTGVSIGAGRTVSAFWVGRGETDAAGLAARIASVLSARGLADNAAVKHALAARGDACDQEDQSVRAEALSALMQNDPETARTMAVKILGNRDECSVPLRRNAVMLIGSRGDDAAVNALIPVAKSDPSPNVRGAALNYLASTQNEAALSAIIALAHSSDDAQVQRMALMSLGQSSSPRARTELRSIIENNSIDENLRIGALAGLDRDRMSAEDATWLRGLYTRTTSPRIKERIIDVVGRSGGDANTQWLAALVRNEGESLESRSIALERSGRTMDLQTLIRLYDASSERPMRQTIVQLLAERKEPEALDKIVDIARSGTDPSMRREAIGVLARSKDPRASRLLLQLVDK